MNDLRFMVKVQLREEAESLFPDCPLCTIRKSKEVEPNTASQLHEIISPPLLGGKYTPDSEDPLAMAVYSRENCILLCPQCNVEIANSVPKAEMIALKMSMPGYTPEQVVTKLRDIAALLRYPDQWVPRSVTFNETEYQIL